MWYVYLLLCDQKTFYVGITNNLVKRIRHHYKKESFFTKKFSDIRLVYCERYNSKKEAVKREKQIKGWGRAKKQMLINGKLGINTCPEFYSEGLALVLPKLCWWVRTFGEFTLNISASAMRAE